jgi:hypothetical protein
MEEVMAFLRTHHDTTQRVGITARVPIVPEMKRHRESLSCIEVLIEDLLDFPDLVHEIASFRRSLSHPLSPATGRPGGMCR